MAKSKKHLKYRATKTGSIEPKASKPSDVLQSSKMTPFTKLKPQKAKAEFSRLTTAQHSIIRRELWHILTVAVGILVVYAIIWAGFHYAGWSEVVLRYIPHGQ